MNSTVSFFLFIQGVVRGRCFCFFHPREPDSSYRRSNINIPPQIKRYPAAGHWCYLGRSFVLPRRDNDLVLATMRKGTCDLEKSTSFIQHICSWSYFYSTQI